MNLERNPGLLNKARKTSLSAGLILALAGCAKDVDFTKPSRVTEAESIAKHTETRTGSICQVKFGDTCWEYNTYDVTVPEKNIVTLEQCQNGPRRSSANEDCIQSTIFVARPEYEKVHKGSIITFEEGVVTVIPQ